MGHHHHHHGHHHHGDASGNIGIAFFLNATFTVIEIIGGFLTGSVAILADAIHDLGDTITLLMAYFLQRFSEKNPDQKNTYGYKRYSLLSALFSGALLLTGSILILFESIPRLYETTEVNSLGMILLAILGTCVNGYAFFKLSGGSTQNEKILKWHLFEDSAGWLAVLIGSILIYLFGWHWLDAVMAILIAIYISFNVIKHLIETAGIFLQQAPKDFDHDRFKEKIKSIEGVQSIHDLHIWSLDGDKNVLSCHVVINELEKSKKVKESIRKLACNLGNYHLTIEIEHSDDVCSDNCDDEESSSLLG